MKNFTTEEVRDLFNRVMIEEIGFTEMVEIMNEMVSERVSERVDEVEKPCVDDIPVRRFKKGDKVRIKEGVSSKTNDNLDPAFVEEMDDLIGKTMTVDRYDDRYGYVICNESDWRFLEDWLEPYVEDIPKPKFKIGDKVRIKDGVSSKTHRHISPRFTTGMDDLIGKELTVDVCANGIVYIDESGYNLHEDWLEPYTDELKKGDLAIFWDDDKRLAATRFYEKLNESEESFRHKDQNGFDWKNAIKFDSVGQLERLIKGEDER